MLVENQARRLVTSWVEPRKQKIREVVLFGVTSANKHRLQIEKLLCSLDDHDVAKVGEARYSRRNRLGKSCPKKVEFEGKTE